MTYTFAPNSHLKGDATPVGLEMAALYREKGELLPDDIIRVATDPTHAFHAYFTWDMGKALAKVQHDEACYLARNIGYLDGDRGWVPIGVMIQRPERRVYVPYVEVVQPRACERQQLVDRGWLELRSWVRRYGRIEFPEFADIVAVVQDAIDAVETVRT